MDTNEVTLVFRREEAPQPLPLLSKEEVAEKILDWVAGKIADRQREGSVFV